MALLVRTVKPRQWDHFILDMPDCTQRFGDVTPAMWRGALDSGWLEWACAIGGAIHTHWSKLKSKQVKVQPPPEADGGGGALGRSKRKRAGSGAGSGGGTGVFSNVFTDENGVVKDMPLLLK